MEQPLPVSPPSGTTTKENALSIQSYQLYLSLFLIIC